MPILFKEAELGTLHCLPYLKFNWSNSSTAPNGGLARGLQGLTAMHAPRALSWLAYVAGVRKGRWNSCAPKFPLPLSFLTPATQAISCIRVKQWSLITWQLQLDNHYLGHSTVCFLRRHYWMLACLTTHLPLELSFYRIPERQEKKLASRSQSLVNPASRVAVESRFQSKHFAFSRIPHRKYPFRPWTFAFDQFLATVALKEGWGIF